MSCECWFENSGLAKNMEYTMRTMFLLMPQIKACNCKVFSSNENTMKKENCYVTTIDFYNWNLAFIIIVSYHDISNNIA